MRYSIEQDADGNWGVYEKESGKKLSDHGTDRRAASREMGRLEALPPKKPKDDSESDEDEDPDEDE